MPSLRALMQGPLPVTAPLVLNPLMAKMVEAAGFPAGYLGGGATGYQKVALEANLNVTEMCQAALDIHAVCSLPLILDGPLVANTRIRHELGLHPVMRKHGFDVLQKSTRQNSIG